MRCLLAGLLLPGSGAAEQAGVEETAVFASFPFLAPRLMSERIAPIAVPLSEALGEPLTFRSAKSYEQFRERLEEGVYDIALIQPFDFASTFVRERYAPLARQDRPLEAVFAVRSDSALERLADLRGQTLALPPEMAAVSRLAATTLSQANLHPGSDLTLRYEENHSACLHLMAIGEVDVCVTSEGQKSEFERNSGVACRVVARSTAIPGILFVAKRALDSKTRRAASDEILSWATDPAAHQMLTTAGFGPFVATQEADYATVIEMHNALAEE